MKLLILTFIASIFVTTAATAQDEYRSIIEPGIYAGGSCSDETGISIFVAGRNISFAAKSFVFVSEATPLSAVLDHGWQKYSEIGFARMSRVGGVDFLNWKKAEGRPPRPTPESLAELPSEESQIGDAWNLYTLQRCESLPLSLSVPHGEPIMFLLEAQSVIEQCDTDKSACVKGLFDVADRHPDGALTTAEWSRVIRVAIYLGVLSEDGLIEVGDTFSGFGVSLVAAPLVATALISSYDYDGDGKTSLEELSHDLSFDGLTPFGVAGDLDDKARAQIDEIISSAKGLLPLLMGIGR